MAKGLPYFKFTTAKWLIGDISFEDYETQGFFIFICALYWERGGLLTESDVIKRTNKATAFNSLKNRFLVVNEEGKISISFLDEQLHERGHVSTINSINGSKGGRPKGAKTLNKKPTAFNSLSESKANEYPIEENRIEENRIDIPSLDVFLENAKVVCKSNNIPFIEYEFAIKSKYQTWVDNGWKDGFNKPIKNWKNKFNNTLPNLKPIKNNAPNTPQTAGLRPLLNQPKP